MKFLLALILCAIVPLSSLAFDDFVKNPLRFIQVPAKTKEDRSAIVNMGVSIEFTRSDSVWGFANESAIKKLGDAGIAILGNFDFDTARGGHEGILDFPNEDSRYHNYSELMSELQALQTKASDIVQVSTIGKTVLGKNIWAIHINTDPVARDTKSSNKPGAIFMGNHHAREHLSLEIPLMLAHYLVDNRTDPQIKDLIDNRDIWIIPMVNPDGAEWDISTGRYKMWRKNRRDNGDGTFGVDLNRNYGFKWGTGGSDTDTSSDIYMGKEPFSEPETQAIRDFVISQPNTKMLLTFHTFSELVLYPWGHTYDEIGNAKDLAVFKKMATTMAGWNKYTPKQSSGLYIASGDTTDWAYGERGIFAFTFELSPTSMFNGGFYPGAGVIDKVFNDNLKPCIYMMQIADDPYKILTTSNSTFLKNYVEPAISEDYFMERHPIPNVN